MTSAKEAIASEKVETDWEKSESWTLSANCKAGMAKVGNQWT